MKYLWLLLAGLVSGGSALELAGIRWNFTPSYPTGIYRISDANQIRVGDRVSICPEDVPLHQLAKDRGYYAFSLRCTGFYTPLLKTVIALPGDHVALDDQGWLLVNQQRVAHSQRLAHDRQGRIMPEAAFLDTGRVPAGRVWVVSGHHPRSWDSRYYGSLPLANIQGVATPLVLF